MERGIDVSGWQHRARGLPPEDGIDWTLVAGAGYSFAIIKATEGRTHSGSRKVKGRHYTEVWSRLAMEQGMDVGHYHFARPDLDEGDPTKEANHFLSYTNGTPHTMRPALDLEWKGGGLDAEQMTDWALEWLQRVRDRRGIAPMIYLNPSWMRRRVNWEDLLGYPLWLAHYTSKPEPSTPDGTDYAIWQYTSEGEVPGIRGDVDLNACPDLDVIRLAPKTPPTTDERLDDLERRVSALESTG
jgi:GH25 family lysozyme M1 (1,4-beta-N-acetylmuramidase)